MPIAPLNLLFDARLLLTVFTVCVLLVLLFTLLMLPSILKAGTRAEEVAKAAYGYIAQTIGIFLMTVSGLPAFFAAFGYASYTNGAYAGLLTIFAVGGLLFLWQDNAMRSLDPASRLLPQLVFVHVWKLIGLLAVLIAGISCAFFLFTNTRALEPGWWILYAGLFLYGVLVSWLTFERPTMPLLPFSSTPMRASGAEKPSVKKASKKTKLKIAHA